MQQHNENTLSEFSAKCRVCLINYDQMTNIFGNDSNCGKIWLAIMECGSVQVSHGDRLPQGICLKCLEKLRVAHEFRSLCILSDQTLRHYINFINNSTVQVSTEQPNYNNHSNIFHSCSVLGAEATNSFENNHEIQTPNSQNGTLLEIPVIENNTTLKEDEFLKYHSPYNNLQPIRITESYVVPKPAYPVDIQTQDQLVDSTKIENTSTKKKLVKKLKSDAHSHKTRNYKPNLTGKFACRVCNKRFDTDKQLTRHETVSHGERKFKCDLCHKRFTERSVLKCHIMAIHSDERPYKCQFCDKSYVARNHLRIHMRSHTGERPFICKICGKRFSQQNILRDHTASHSGLRPFECTQCNARFIRIGHLRRHTEVVHKDGRTIEPTRKTQMPRPHPCHVCNKSFIRKEHLLKHSAIHSGQRPYKCNMCDKTFIRKWDVKRHMVVHKEGHITVIVSPTVAQAALDNITNT